MVIKFRNCETDQTWQSTFNYDSCHNPESVIPRAGDWINRDGQLNPVSSVEWIYNGNKLDYIQVWLVKQSVFDRNQPATKQDVKDAVFYQLCN
jgi:hypothetical protein